MTTGVIDAVNTTQQVANTTTETTIATVVMPAGSVSQDSLLRVSAVGRLVNSGGTYTHTYRLKANGTTLMTIVKSLGSSGNAVSWWLQYLISFADASTQNIGARGDWASNATAGNGAGTTTGGNVVGWNETAVDMTGTVTFTLTVELSNAAAGVYDELFSLTLERADPLA